MTDIKKKAPLKRDTFKPDYTTMERISFFSRDPEGSIFGVVSISKGCILDVSYNAIQHEMAVTMKASTLAGYTMVEPVQNVRVADNKQKVPLSSYTTHELLKIDAYNHTLVIRDEGEMRKLWTWLKQDADLPFATLMQIRSDMVKKIEEEKVKAEARRKEAEEKANKKDQDKVNDVLRKVGLVDEAGNPIESSKEPVT